MTLRPLLLAAVFAAAPWAAQAQSAVQGADTSQISFRGDVAAGCLLATPAAPSGDNVIVGSLGPGTADIAISQLVDEDGAPLGATVILTLPAICNQAHSLNLLSLNGGLAGDGPEATGGPFRSNLPYQVTVSWGGVQQVFESTDGLLNVEFGQALAGPITITIQIPAGGAPLVAGAYADELVLELGVAG